MTTTFQTLKSNAQAALDKARINLTEVKDQLKSPTLLEEEKATLTAKATELEKTIKTLRRQLRSIRKSIRKSNKAAEAQAAEHPGL